ncbi:pupal cuticle protein-like [Toxorhynchites rutilus septentrionalis]|uniref:pupal cuticle protein-like n=1 Tax=Toxorhynchites rutilus septentrionalis TaxID=329112 RepID=UPI0024795A10|nr:pupal cuticle protein-like [Toxorhynchites rutilus septentrionalis]
MKTTVLASALLFASFCSAEYFGNNPYIEQSWQKPIYVGAPRTPSTFSSVPEIDAARAVHLATHSATITGQVLPAPHAHNSWHGPVHIPVIHKGVPLETPEVQHAKAAHVAAYAETLKHHASSSSQGAWQEPHHHHHAHHSARVNHDHELHHAHNPHPQPYGSGWHGPQHIPVIKNGVPVDTPEVREAKAAHLDALVSAFAHSGPPGQQDDGFYRSNWDHSYY